MDKKSKANPNEVMSTKEFSSALAKLIQKGKSNHGTVSPTDITDTLSTFSLDSDQIAEITAFLETKNIDVLDTADSDNDSDNSPFQSDDGDDTFQQELKQIEAEEEESAKEVQDVAYGNLEDPVRMYLKDIGQVKLLSSEEEVAIAVRIENGTIADSILANYFSNGNITDTVTEEMLFSVEEIADFKEEKVDEFVGITYGALLNYSADGKAAKSELAEANLRLVVSIAKKYIGRGMSFLDLIQEGNLGLMKAVDKFDHRKGFKFSTYATWWIRQAISRSIADQARTIRIPVHMVETINKYARISRQLTSELGHDPTTAEIAKAMGVEESKVEEIRKIAIEPTSLDAPVGEEDENQLSDFIKDKTTLGPAEAANFSSLRKELETVMESLTEREQKVLRLRFGLDDGQARTLEEVGQDFDVTRERIRQIEAKALRKLRHPTRAKRLVDYLE